ncbi:MAG: transcriptional regulator NrdR [Deltaproteobacteria bacterium]|nr:transcriptional regulator NrdR [Deltaproteobacteria bacterium]
MKCPYCGSFNNKVVDSRLSREGIMIRRRRECDACQRRFTTYEKVEEIHPVVIKKDGRREPFQREKIAEGIQSACQKRPISVEAIEEFIDLLEQSFQDSGRKEIATKEIGELVIAKLHEWDDVAYVRFASVYRQFKDPGDFMQELKEMLESRKKKETKKKKK